MSLAGWCTQGSSVPQGRAEGLPPTCGPGPGAEELEVETLSGWSWPRERSLWAGSTAVAACFQLGSLWPTDTSARNALQGVM